MELELLTPMRLTQGKRRELRCFELPVFTARLLNRLVLIQETSAWVRHSIGREVRRDEEQLQAEISGLAARFSVVDETHVRDATRCGHGGHRHAIGGLCGVVHLISADPWALRRLARALVVGAWVGVGRCATMGLGRLRIRPAIAPAPLPTPVPGSRGAILEHALSDRA